MFGEVEANLCSMSLGKEFKRRVTYISFGVTVGSGYSNGIAGKISKKLISVL